MSGSAKRSPGTGRWLCGRCKTRAEDVGSCAGYCGDATGASCDAKSCPQCGEFHCWTAAPQDMETYTGEGEFRRDVVRVLSEVGSVLFEKNRAYGDSALNPVRLFSKAGAAEQILVRIDDKLSRLARGHAAGEDVEIDLLGYLVLLRVARMREADSGD